MCVCDTMCACPCLCLHLLLLLLLLILQGRQLTIFNSQTTVRVGAAGAAGAGEDTPSAPSPAGGMFQGQLAGLYYNGLRILNMAAEGHPHIKVEGSARLVGDMPSSSITPQSSAAAAGGNRSDSAPSISDITTTTATNRKQGTTQQVSSAGFCRRRHFVFVFLCFPSNVFCVDFNPLFELKLFECVCLYTFIYKYIYTYRLSPSWLVAATFSIQNNVITVFCAVSERNLSVRSDLA